jgi:hypothetical protein
MVSVLFQLIAFPVDTRIVPPFQLALHPFHLHQLLTIFYPHTPISVLLNLNLNLLLRPFVVLIVVDLFLLFVDFSFGALFIGMFFLAFIIVVGAYTRFVVVFQHSYVVRFVLLHAQYLLFFRFLDSQTSLLLGVLSLLSTM